MRPTRRDAAVVLAAFLSLWAAVVAAKPGWRLPGNWYVLIALAWFILALAHLPWRSHP